MRATALLSLSLLSACVESASAQPRPDAGRRFNIRPPASETSRRADPRQVNRTLLRALIGAGDAGLADLFRSSPPVTDPRDAVGGLALRSAGDGGLGALTASGFGVGGGGLGRGGFGAGGLGVRGTAPATVGYGRGYGGMNGPVSLDVRYDDVSLQGELPRPALRAELRRAELRTRACLRALGPHGAIDAPVRLIVRPPTTVDAVTVEGAAEGVTRCAREALQRMILGPVTAPVELSAWLRAAAVTP